MAQTRTDRHPGLAADVDPTELLTRADRAYRATVLAVLCAAVFSAACILAAPLAYAAA